MVQNMKNSSGSFQGKGHFDSKLLPGKLFVDLLNICIFMKE